MARPGLPAWLPSQLRGEQGGAAFRDRAADHACPGPPPTGTEAGERLWFRPRSEGAGSRAGSPTEGCGPGPWSHPTLLPRSFLGPRGTHVATEVPASLRARPQPPSSGIPTSGCPRQSLPLLPSQVLRAHPLPQRPRSHPAPGAPWLLSETPEPPERESPGPRHRVLSTSLPRRH